MIVGVSSVLNEADIIERTIEHLYGQGADQVIVSDGGSTDGTRDILAEHGLCDQTGPFDQGAEITRLAYMAAEVGADWIIPFDADEFWIDPLGTTVKTVLDKLPSDCLKVHSAIFKHADWDHKYESQNPLGKVAFRPTETMTVAWGNHDVQLSEAGDEEHGLLEVREWQYRDYEHFLAKVGKARDLFASWDVPEHHGHHMRVLAEMDDAQLAAEWDRITCAPWVYDPIP